MTGRIYISEIQSELPYKTRRTVRKWCRNNHVRILSDIGSNKQYALRAEYENAKCRNYHIHQEAINSSMAFSEYSTTEKANEYKPLGEIEGNFLNRLQNLNRTL
jgi:hypothetical protein